jgi:shikimate kinase
MLYLIGFMGVGKSTIGKKIALQHKVDFIDTDAFIEESLGYSINIAFQKDGENAFREMESDLIHNIKKESIISCGGGLPIHNNNMQHLLKTGTVIYLKASAKNLYNRLKNKTESRPLINKIQQEDLKDFISKKLNGRNEIYSIAHHIIETDSKSELEILREINSLISFS